MSAAVLAHAELAQEIAVAVALSNVVERYRRVAGPYGNLRRDGMAQVHDAAIGDKFL